MPLIIQNAKDVDTLLAKDLNQLSLKERDGIYEGIHGVNATIEETPELVIGSCVQLQIAIDQVSSEDKKAYDIALENDEDYVRSEKFQLMFLRSDDFNIPKTARRIVTYHTKMLEHFGPQVLGRPLYYEDLTKEAQAYLKTGVVQVVPNCRDSSGRAIFMENYLQAEKITKSTLAMVQTYIYVNYCAIEHDELTQMRGFISISYIIGQLLNKNIDGDAYRQATDMQYWFPMKFQAIHICFHNPIWHFFAPLAWIVMGQDLRRRVRIHDGAHLECLYALQSFGIPVDKLPVDFQGDVKATSYLKFLERRQAIETAMKS